jgi:hypothetical protein
MPQISLATNLQKLSANFSANMLATLQHFLKMDLNLYNWSEIQADSTNPPPAL